MGPISASKNCSSHLQVYPHRADRCIVKNCSTHQMPKSWAPRRMGEPTARAQLQASSYIHRLTAQIGQLSGQQSSAGHACLTHRTNLHYTRTRAPSCADRPALTAPSPRASRVRRAAPTKTRLQRQKAEQQAMLSCQRAPLRQAATCCPRCLVSSGTSSCLPGEPPTLHRSTVSKQSGTGEEGHRLLQAGKAQQAAGQGMHALLGG